MSEEIITKLVKRLENIENAVFPNPPSRKKVINILCKMIRMLLPCPSFLDESNHQNNYDGLEKLMRDMEEQIELCKVFCTAGYELNPARCTEEIMFSLPTVKSLLITDAEAILKGDPAATSVNEVILCYPGFFATVVYRIAHEFYLRNIPILPRMMSEFAHEKTGIDIHPGAKIGFALCIDHGTGVVIGETAIIGDRVRIYQGVTLGAKSFRLTEHGEIIKGEKRHPTIGNDCILYANATILGGDTVIGDGCVIGGNTWITHSVPKGQKIYYTKNN